MERNDSCLKGCCSLKGFEASSLNVTSSTQVNDRSDVKFSLKRLMKVIENAYRISYSRQSCFVYVSRGKCVLPKEAILSFSGSYN